jgi:hypothetical protein
MLLKINDDHHRMPWLHSLVMDDAVAADRSSEGREPLSCWQPEVDANFQVRDDCVYEFYDRFVKADRLGNDQTTTI